MKEQKSSINGMAVNYKTIGQGKPILILHGWGVGSDSWMVVGELLAQNNYWVIVPDLPGFGKSQEPDKAWEFDDYIRWIEQFVKEMKLDKFYLVGHSFGGALAAKFTVLHPGMVDKLVLCDAAIVRKDRLDWRQTYAKRMAHWKNNLLRLPFAPRIYPFAKKVLYRFAGNHDYELASPLMKETFKNIINIDLLEYTRNINSQTLIIWGDKDLSTPVEDAYEIQKAVKNSKLEIIAGAGHKLHRTHSPQLAQIINSFLRI
jgi:pimeloyl-ACP methyl ester carboxylesterase